MSLGTEAHELAGHPSLRLAGIGVVSGAVASTVANVAGYQANSKLAKAKGESQPSLNPTTGTTPANVAPSVNQVSKSANRKYSRAVGSAHRKYSSRSKGAR